MNDHSWLLSSEAIWPDPLFSHRGYLCIEIDRLSAEGMIQFQEELDRDLEITIEVYAPGDRLMPDPNLYYRPLPKEDILHKKIDEAALFRRCRVNRILYKDMTLHMGMPSKPLLTKQHPAKSDR